jgi:hypothetical protein
VMFSTSSVMFTERRARKTSLSRSMSCGVRLTGGYGQHRSRLLHLLRHMGLTGGFLGPHARRGELVSPAGSGAGPAPDRSARLTRIMNSAMIRISARMPAETR